MESAIASASSSHRVTRGAAPRCVAMRATQWRTACVVHRMRALPVWCVTQSALPVASPHASPYASPHASPHASRGVAPSRRAAPPRRAWQCIAWRGCHTPSARSLPRARPSSHGSRRPSASCAAAAAAAAAAAVAAAWRQAHGSRPRAACRDHLRARRCMGPSELLIRELGPLLSPQQAIWSPLSALCVASRLDEYLGLGAFV